MYACTWAHLCAFVVVLGESETRRIAVGRHRSRERVYGARN